MLPPAAAAAPAKTKEEAACARACERHASFWLVLPSDAERWWLLVFSAASSLQHPGV